LIDFGAWEKKSWHLKHKSKNLLVWKKRQRQVSAQLPATRHQLFSSLSSQLTIGKLDTFLSYEKAIYSQKHTTPFSSLLLSKQKVEHK
jgi:hypothetical protein